jgi:DNA-binding LytR/AlgR family response regulator
VLAAAGDGTMTAPAALLVDDEPLLRERLAGHLARLWPMLRIVGMARHGREALALYQAEAPEIVFLDVHMPGMDGIEAARAIAAEAAAAGRAVHLVFVTAFERYAVQAFEQGAVDYLVKPFDEPRLAATVRRLRERLAATPVPAADPASLDSLLDRLAERLRGPAAPARQRLQWIRASVGPAIRLIPIEEVVYFKSDEKYTLVAWTGGEALIRKSLRELQGEIDPERFVQIHRAVVVALPFVAQVVRGDNETAELHLRGRPEVLPVSRSYTPRFRQM